MIETLRISNFKSIRKLELSSRRVNVFIGRPNTGKSNILEALGLLSFAVYGNDSGTAHKFVRFEETGDLVYDRDVSKEVRVSADKQFLRLEFIGRGVDGYLQSDGQKETRVMSGDHRNLNWQASELALTPFKFYRFETLPEYQRTEREFLLPPDGANLLTLLRFNREWHDEANELFKPYDLRLRLLPAEYRIQIERLDERTATPVPYTLGSDTLRRFVFYTVIIRSNRESVLVLEEPEAHAFPAYTKQLAELIALDNSGNQYFLSTHNPYFLEPLIEKCPKGELAVVGVTYEDHETKARRLNGIEIQRLLQGDPFFQLDSVLKPKRLR